VFVGNHYPFFLPYTGKAAIIIYLFIYLFIYLIIYLFILFRSAAYIKMGQFHKALQDAVKAKDLNPEWPKVTTKIKNVVEVTYFYDRKG
jgi:hypothetical protein